MEFIIYQDHVYKSVEKYGDYVIIAGTEGNVDFVHENEITVCDDKFIADNHLWMYNN